MWRSGGAVPKTASIAGAYARCRASWTTTSAGPSEGIGVEERQQLVVQHLDLAERAVAGWN